MYSYTIQSVVPLTPPTRLQKLPDHASERLGVHLFSHHNYIIMIIYIHVIIIWHAHCNATAAVYDYTIHYTPVLKLHFSPDLVKYTADYS